MQYLLVLEDNLSHSLTQLNGLTDRQRAHKYNFFDLWLLMYFQRK